MASGTDGVSLSAGATIDHPLLGKVLVEQRNGKEVRVLQNYAGGWRVLNVWEQAVASIGRPRLSSAPVLARFAAGGSAPGGRCPGHGPPLRLPQGAAVRVLAGPCGVDGGVDDGAVGGAGLFAQFHRQAISSRRAAAGPPDPWYWILPMLPAPLLVDAVANVNAAAHAATLPMLAVPLWLMVSPMW